MNLDLIRQYLDFSVRGNMSDKDEGAASIDSQIKELPSGQAKASRWDNKEGTSKSPPNTNE